MSTRTFSLELLNRNRVRDDSRMEECRREASELHLQLMSGLGRSPIGRKENRRIVSRRLEAVQTMMRQPRFDLTTARETMTTRGNSMSSN